MRLANHPELRGAGLLLLPTVSSMDTVLSGVCTVHWVPEQAGRELVSLCWPSLGFWSLFCELGEWNTHLGYAPSVCFSLSVPFSLHLPGSEDQALLAYRATESEQRPVGLSIY